MAKLVWATYRLDIVRIGVAFELDKDGMRDGHG